MQTVNFNCSVCDKLMAVGLNLLGRNVRCPHCKQVVQAPSSPASVKTPPSAFKSSRPPNKPPSKTGEVQESIFGEAQNEDLFGRAPTAPQPLPEQHLPQPTQSNAHLYAPTVDMPPAPWQTSDRTEVTSPVLGDEMRERHYERREPAVRDSGGGGGMFVWILLLYAVIVTGIAAWFFYERTQQEEKRATAGTATDKDHPYFAIPDFFGQYDRAERKKLSMINHMPKADLKELPNDLQARLGNSITIGDIQVTPIKVEYRQLKRYRKYADRPAVLSPNNPEVYLYVLSLVIKNTSQDVYLCPTDPAFARRKESAKESPPYNRIIFGKNNSYSGGPFLWPDPDYEYEFLEDQKDDGVPLAPGEERTYLIGCDRYIIDIKSALREYPSEPIQWRVQLRRGLVKANDDSGEEREISASCVIGVNLDNADFPKTD